MWFVSGGGLNRYDGYNFKYYPIAGTDVYSIREDADRNIWVQANERYFVYNRVKDCVEDNITDILQGMDIQDEIELLSVDYDHNIWLSAGGELIYYEMDEDREQNASRTKFFCLCRIVLTIECIWTTHLIYGFILLILQKTHCNTIIRKPKC